MVQKLTEKIEALQAEMDAGFAERKTKVDGVLTAELDKQTRKRASDLHLLSVITGKDIADIKGFEDVKEVAERAMIPKLPSAVAGATGLPEWLGEQFANDLLERVQVLANAEALFPKYTMPANTEVFSIPQKTDNTKAYLIAPAADAVESALTSGKVSFQTKRLITFAIVSDQASDETVLALLEVVKQDIAESLVKAMENAIINGDTATTGNINGDTVGADAKDQTKAFDGLRKLSTGNTVTFGGTPTYANIVKMRKQMGNYGVALNDLVYIVSPSTYFNLTLLPELLTMDKYGDKATVVTGEVAKLGGVPVIVSEYVGENLTAAGIVDDTTPGTATVILLVNKRFFAVADRGSVGFEQDRSIRTTSDMFIGYRDIDFKKLYSSTQVSCLGLDVTV
jgi:HK97 family phage major capsid protein